MTGGGDDDDAFDIILYLLLKRVDLVEMSIPNNAAQPHCIVFRFVSRQSKQTWTHAWLWWKKFAELNYQIVFWRNLLQRDDSTSCNFSNLLHGTMSGIYFPRDKFEKQNNEYNKRMRPLE